MSTITPSAPTTGASDAFKRHTTIVVAAMESENVDTICYRGTAPIADLATISQADVFDQVTNPTGLQRDLSPKHAADAYNYLAREATTEFPRAFPEVILNVRDEDVVSVEEIVSGRQRQVKLFRFTFDLDAIADAEKVAVSRVDGNHRLFYAAGDGKNRQPLALPVPFQLHVGLSSEQEANLFVDVNANQKGLNSSHLHILRSRLTPEEQELRDNPHRVYARRLSEDSESPWYGLVHLGGSKKGSREQGADRPVSFVTLEQGVRRTLSKSQYIHDLTNPNAQYVLIRNYWNAVKAVLGTEWEDAKEHLLLKNIGVLSFSILGGTIIDRCMARGEVETESMMAYVEQVAGTFDWHREARGEKSVSGMSGNRAALLISGEMATELVDPGESRAISSLQEKLLSEAADAPPPDKADEATEQPEVRDLVAAGVQPSVRVEDTGEGEQA